MGEPTQKYSREELLEDIRSLARTLEDSHPTPYRGHGGRVAFHRRFEDLLRAVPEGGEPLEPFHRRAQRFTARIRDGHTQLRPPDSSNVHVDGRVPVEFRVVGESLYVDEIYDREYGDLLGGRLLSVSGVDVADLRAQQAAVESADNRYGDLKYLCDALGPEPASLRRLLDPPTSTPEVTVERPDGTTKTRAVELVDAESPARTLERTVDGPETAGEPAYRLLDGGDTALLSLPDCHSHREVHEVIAAPGGPAEAIYDTRETYRRLVGEPVPESREDIVAGLPSATEVLTDLVRAMADAGTERLVVDVRHNAGGTSLLPYLLVYVLHGWDGIATATGDQYEVSKDSELYREQFGEEGPIEDTENPAGFDFTSYFADDEQQVEQVRAQLSRMSPTVAEELERGTHEAYHRPDSVFVVTSARTFSAGLEPAVLLAKLGADVVGVPPSQSPNGPRDKLVTDLPNTGLELQVSYRYHVFLPERDGRVLEPDIPLTRERFEALDRPADAGVRLALDAADR